MSVDPEIQRMIAEAEARGKLAGEKEVVKKQREYERTIEPVPSSPPPGIPEGLQFASTAGLALEVGSNRNAMADLDARLRRIESLHGLEGVPVDVVFPAETPVAIEAVEDEDEPAPAFMVGSAALDKCTCGANRYEHNDPEFPGGCKRTACSQFKYPLEDEDGSVSEEIPS